MPPLNDTSEPCSCELNSSGHSTINVDQPKKNVVKFGTVAIREFDRIVGDHPDCKVGPPITFGWDWSERPVEDLDVYESSRVIRKNLRLTSITRKNLLHNVFGIPESEIRMAEKEVQKILRQRATSQKQTKVAEKTEAFVQSAKRKLKRAFSTQNLLNGMLVSQRAMLPMMVQ